MAVVTNSRVDFAGDEPGSARAEIRAMLASDHRSTRKIYAALAHKVWSLLIERRLDNEVRDWHRLILDVRANVQKDDTKVSERLVALIDLLRESISLAETSPVEELARRPHARGILVELQKAASFVPRRSLQQVIGIGTSHLSNVLSKLVAHNLVERRDAGKEAEFRLTARGREVLGVDLAIPFEKLREAMDRYLPPREAPTPLAFAKKDTHVLMWQTFVSTTTAQRQPKTYSVYNAQDQIGYFGHSPLSDKIHVSL